MLLLPSYQLAQFTATYILTARCNTPALIMFKLLIQAFTHDADCRFDLTFACRPWCRQSRRDSRHGCGPPQLGPPGCKCLECMALYSFPLVQPNVQMALTPQNAPESLKTGTTTLYISENLCSKSAAAPVCYSSVLARKLSARARCIIHQSIQSA
jgi:hypothetical protein